MVLLENVRQFNDIYRYIQHTIQHSHNGKKRLANNNSFVDRNDFVQQNGETTTETKIGYEYNELLFVDIKNAAVMQTTSIYMFSPFIGTVCILVQCYSKQPLLIAVVAEKKTHFIRVYRREWK